MPVMGRQPVMDHQLDCRPNYRTKPASLEAPISLLNLPPIEEMSVRNKKKLWNRYGYRPCVLRDEGRQQARHHANAGVIWSRFDKLHELNRTCIGDIVIRLLAARQGSPALLLDKVSAVVGAFIPESGELSGLHLV